MIHNKGQVITKKKINMESYLKISTWNLCLGLPNKKDLVCDYLKMNNVSACCMQETEIQRDFPEDILNCNDYIIELEQNNLKKRVGIYRQSPVKSPDIKTL